MKHYDREEFEPPVRKQSWGDWDGWLIVSWLAVAVIAAAVAVGFGHAQ